MNNTTAADAAFAVQVADLFAKAAHEIGDDDAAAEEFAAALIAAFREAGRNDG
jgi:hypothetical protein